MGLFPCEFGFPFNKDSFKSIFFTNNDYSSRSVSFELEFKNSFNFDAVLFTEDNLEDNSHYEYAKHTDYEIDVNLAPYAEFAKLSIHISDKESGKESGKVDFDVLNNTFWISIYLSEKDFDALIPTIKYKDIYIDFNILCTKSDDDVEDTIKKLIVDDVKKQVLVLNKFVKSVEIGKLTLTAKNPKLKKIESDENQLETNKEDLNKELISKASTTNQLLTQLLKKQEMIFYIIIALLILIFFK